MSQAYDARTQELFAAAVCRALRESRRRQKLTQADVAQRTGGLVSKAALANYETGHRSLRIDVLWVIARALGEDLGGLLNMAERGIGRWQSAVGTGSITVDVAEVMEGEDPRLAPVRRWFELRAGGGTASAMTLDDGAILALASLMNVTPAECREILMRTAVDAGGPAAGRADAADELPGDTDDDLTDDDSADPRDDLTDDQDGEPVDGSVAQHTGHLGQPAAI